MSFTNITQNIDHATSCQEIDDLTNQTSSISLEHDQDIYSTEVETDSESETKELSNMLFSKQTPSRDQIYNSLPNHLRMRRLISDIVFSYIGKPFIITLNVTRSSIKIPVVGSVTGTVIIEWGDGEFSTIEEEFENITHFYENLGIYTVYIHGDVTHLSFKNVNELVEISQWGSLRLVDSDMKNEGAFTFCENLVLTAQDSPNLRYITNLSYMFECCSSLTGDVSNWDVRNVVNMSAMFSDCKVFNSDLSGWDVSNVKDMSFMFSESPVFNSDLSMWNVSKVENMSGMFSGCALFNSDLSRWNVESVLDMSYMFSDCEYFNSSLSEWNVRNVKTMEQMFRGCKNFRGYLSRWVTCNVENMNEMFYECSHFNTDLSNWDVGKVENMCRMFKRCTLFNSDLSKWNLDSCYDTSEMFSDCTLFNCDLSKWNVSNVDNMYMMFSECVSFNSDISGWDISNVTDMTEMFVYCELFTCDLSNWEDINPSVNIADMFIGCHSIEQKSDNKRKREEKEDE